jgi:hypothetical protein
VSYLSFTHEEIKRRAYRSWETRAGGLWVCLKWIGMKLNENSLASNRRASS